MIPKGLLPQMRTGNSFDLFYSLRDASGDNIHAVRDERLVDQYEEAVKDTLVFLTAQPLSLPTPSPKVRIYCFEIQEVFPEGGSPFTDADQDRNPYIALPSRSEAPTIEEELRHAAAAACHETFHAVVWRCKPLRSLVSLPWRWFHEGCAVWTEMRVLPNNLSYLSYALNWCDRPSVSLDDDRMIYESGFFVHYLASRFGAGLIGRIWTIPASLKETPFDLINRTCEGGWALLFHAYCHDAYFVADPKSHCYDPHIVRRFRRRAVEREIRLGPNGSVRLTGSLPRLSCRYYTFHGPTQPVIKSADADTALQVKLVPSTVDWTEAKESSNINHWVVIISNSNWLPMPRDTSYDLEVSTA